MPEPAAPVFPTADLVVRGGVVLTVDDRDTAHERADVVVRGDRILAVVPGRADVPSGARVVDAAGCAVLPGFVNSHSHACQRALRGRAAGTDFWTWRDGMLEEADRATPTSVRVHYAGATFRDAQKGDGQSLGVSPRAAERCLNS